MKWRACEAAQSIERRRDKLYCNLRHKAIPTPDALYQLQPSTRPTQRSARDRHPRRWDFLFRREYTCQDWKNCQRFVLTVTRQRVSPIVVIHSSEITKTKPCLITAGRSYLSARHGQRTGGRWGVALVPFVSEHISLSCRRRRLQPAARDKETGIRRGQQRSARRRGCYLRRESENLQPVASAWEGAGKAEENIKTKMTYWRALREQRELTRATDYLQPATPGGVTARGKLTGWGVTVMINHRK